MSGFGHMLCGIIPQPQYMEDVTKNAMKRTPLKRKTALRTKTSLRSKTKPRARGEKTKPGRLAGDALRSLCQKVYEREEGLCAICGRYVEEGTKPHHVIFKSHGGKDTIDNLILLCMQCHAEVHFSRDGSQEIRQRCLDYLYSLYSETK